MRNRRIQRGVAFVLAIAMVILALPEVAIADETTAESTPERVVDFTGEITTESTPAPVSDLENETTTESAPAPVLTSIYKTKTVSIDKILVEQNKATDDTVKFTITIWGYELYSAIISIRSNIGTLIGDGAYGDTNNTNFESIEIEFIDEDKEYGKLTITCSIETFKVLDGYIIEITSGSNILETCIFKPAITSLIVDKDLWGPNGGDSTITIKGTDLNVASSIYLVIEGPNNSQEEIKITNDDSYEIEGIYTFPPNTTGMDEVYTITAEIRDKGGIVYPSFNTKVTVKPIIIITSVTAVPPTHNSSGGDSTITVVGTNLEYADSITLTVTGPDNYSKTYAWESTSTKPLDNTLTTTWTFPANTAGADKEYKIIATGMYNNDKPVEANNNVATVTVEGTNPTVTGNTTSPNSDSSNNATPTPTPTSTPTPTPTPTTTPSPTPEPTATPPEIEVIEPDIPQSGWYGWRYIVKYWYYFFEGGDIAKGWNYLPYEGEMNWYFVGSVTGAKQIGWKYIYDAWYYLNPDNFAAMHEGWLKDRGNWYYLNPGSGKLLYGWQWLEWQGQYDWYYFLPSGAMVTGWNYLDWNGQKNWYFFNGEGRMQTGWVHYHKEWFYLHSNGRMHSGWLKYDDKLYYMHEPDGYMVTNGYWEVGGRVYLFGSDGLIIR